MPLDALPTPRRSRSEATRIKLKHTLTRLMVAARGRVTHVPIPLIAPTTARRDEARQVALVAAALDLLAPASLHASAYGTPRDVVVADEELATIFRAALAITTERRGTDRLVRVVVRAPRAATET